MYLRGRELDRLGLLIDFREARRLLREAIEPFDHRCLNDLEAFRDTNPTTENIARLVYEAISARLPLACPDASRRGVAVARVVAWESQGCGASYSKENC